MYLLPIGLLTASFMVASAVPATGNGRAARENPHKLDCGTGQETSDWGTRLAIKNIRAKAEGHGAGIIMRPYLDANQCSRVACERGSAIWWCNAAEHERLLDSWNNIADGAQVIYDGCMNDFGGVQGTLFQENDWRVMVGADLGCPGS